jgi:acyl-CoA reductase-like NAD-dependent aldehyde dehydrogenase
MQRYDIYAGGSFLRTETLVNVKNPYTMDYFAQTFLAGKKELEKAIQAALSVEKQMKGLPLYQRYEILMSIATMIRENQWNRQSHTFMLSQKLAERLRHSLLQQKNLKDFHWNI